MALVKVLFFGVFFKCTIKKLLFFYDKGVFYNLKSRKPPFIRRAGLFAHLPYEIPTFQATPPNLVTHPISPLNINSLQNKPSLPEGIFSLNSLKIKVSLLFTLVIHLLTHLSSSFADKNISH